MRVVIQRVSSASVKINQQIVGEIGMGLLILVGFEDTDTQTDVEWMSSKICNLRIFNDENGVMNLSAVDVKGQFLVVSQFTLHAKTKKGNRPSYVKAATPDLAIPLYKSFVDKLHAESNLKVATGEFGAHMDVALVNDGPVTIIIDTKNKE
jgi:D-aminoacyl-tRNA deacylase